MTTEGDTMNFSAFEGKDTVTGQLIDLAETLPFFAERRVILVEDSGFFKSSNDLLSDYFTAINPTTCFIFAESEVDKRSKILFSICSVTTASTSEASITSFFKV